MNPSIFHHIFHKEAIPIYDAVFTMNIHELGKNKYTDPKIMITYKEKIMDFTGLVP
jgi:hypothetical protein